MSRLFTFIRRIRWLLISLALIAAPIYTAMWIMERPARSIWNQIKIGHDEHKVLEILGPPIVQYDRETAPPNYYSRMLSGDDRPITNKVLIYTGGIDLYMYVWIDNEGKVEDIFIGGT